MPDDYRERIKSMTSCFWALSLFGVDSLVRILFQGEVGPAGDAMATLQRNMTEHLSPMSQSIAQAGEHWQHGMVDVMAGLATGDPLTPQYLTKVVVEGLQQAVAGAKWLLPDQENHLRWQELQNKLQAFSVFAHVEVSLPHAAALQPALATLVAQAAALGPYVRVWALEGLGR